MVEDANNENHAERSTSAATITFVLKYKSESELYRRWPLLLTDPLPEGVEIVDYPEDEENAGDKDGSVHGNNGEDRADNDEQNYTNKEGEFVTAGKAVVDRHEWYNDSDCDNREGGAAANDFCDKAPALDGDKNDGSHAQVFDKFRVAKNGAVTLVGKFGETDEEFIRRHNRLDAEREASCRNWPAGPVHSWPFYGGPIDRTKKAKRPKIKILSL